MFANFCVFALLLSLACYATLGGRNANGQSVDESVILEQIIEDIELIEEEPESDVETEFVEETEYFTSCPSDEAEEVVEDVRTPFECSYRKPKKSMRCPAAKRYVKAKSATCPCHMADNAMEEESEMPQVECAARTPSKPRLVKRITKRVIPSTKHTARPAETESCSPAVEPNVEEVLPEYQEPVEETKPSSKSDKQMKVETMKETGKQNEKLKVAKQSQKNKQKSKNQNKGKEQKPGNTKSNKKSKQ